MPGVQVATGMPEPRVCRVLKPTKSAQRYWARSYDDGRPLLKWIPERCGPILGWDAG